MWPITFKVLNAKDFCDFSGGFEPTIYKDEFWDVKNESGTGSIHELGDPRERLLAAALDMIQLRTVQPDSRPSATRAADISMQELSIPTDPRRGGTKYITNSEPQQ
jgi:hypothetical protein